MCALVNRSVRVLALGRMGFMAAYDVQMRYARQHLEALSGNPSAHGEDTLLLVEHAPVYTTGVRDKHIPKSVELALKKTGAEFYQTNRGGPISFHGPGQLVAYPILNLRHFNPSLKWYSCQLEKTMLATLKQFGLAGRTTDHSGISVGNRKIGAIGIHESKSITTHGVALNCNVGLDWFKHLAPHDHDGSEVTSLSRELEYNVGYNDAVKSFLRCFQEVFDCELEFKMLEEKELQSVCVTRHASVGKEFEGGASVVGHSSRAELGLRHMSTLSAPNNHEKGVFSLRMNPMW